MARSAILVGCTSGARAFPKTMRARMRGPAFQPREEVLAAKKEKIYRQTHDPGSDRRGAKAVARVLGKIRRAIPEERQRRKGRTPTTLSDVTSSAIKQAQGFQKIW